MRCMNTIKVLLDIFLHLDTALSSIAAQFGIGIYAILFFVFFSETGLVVTPFLPGDSLLFAIGAFASVGGVSIWVAFTILLSAAILGNTVNYIIGNNLGIAFFNRPGKRQYIHERHLEKTKLFFIAHGSKAVILSRFIPIIRTFAPFIAGVSQMKISEFMFSNIVGALAWVSLFLFGGYFFGTIPFVKEHFSLVIFIIILVTTLPPIIVGIRHKV